MLTKLKLANSAKGLKKERSVWTIRRLIRGLNGSTGVPIESANWHVINFVNELGSVLYLTERRSRPLKSILIKQ